RADAAERFDEKPIAREDRGRVAVHRAGGERASPERAEVDDVVVEERRAVHELDGDRELHRFGRNYGLRSAEPRTEDDEERTQALAAEREEVRGALADHARIGLDGGELGLEALQIAREHGEEAVELARELVELDAIADAAQPQQRRVVQRSLNRPRLDGGL